MQVRTIAVTLFMALAACGSTPAPFVDASGVDEVDARDESGGDGDIGDGGPGGPGGDDGGNGGGDGGSGGGDGGNGGGDGGGSTGDGGTSTPCAAPQDPTQTYALSGSAAFGDSRWPRMAYAGGSVFAIGPFSNDTGWYKWAGGGWSFITPPWPAGPRPYIIDIFDLPTGRVLFFVQITHAANNYDYALIEFDGATMSAPLVLPATWRGNVKKATRTVDGTYHVLTYHAPGDPVWSSRSHGGVAWSAASPVPIPTQVDPQNVALTSLTNGRMTLLYTYGHLYELHRGVGEVWSTAVDLTPSWAVSATNPVAVGARGGGVAVAVTGVSNSYRFPYYWDSVDGVTYSAGEYTNPATQLQDQTKFLALDCIAQPVLVIRRQDSIMLLERGVPSNWPPLATGASHYSAGGSAAITPDGKTFFGWSYTLSNGNKFTTLLATP